MKTAEQILNEEYDKEKARVGKSLDDTFCINAMKEYATAVLNEFIDTYIDEINVHDKIIDLFKRQNIQ